MADGTELARLTVALDARIDQFERKVIRAEQRFRATGRAVETTAARIDRTGSQGFTNIGNAAQQAGFQIGDFAVQVASGGNPIVALTQQGSQLLGMFGMWGAVLGAAGAVLGALVIGLGGAADESRNLELATGALESGVRDLETAAIAYADAISATASAQGAASDSIVADTRREYEAKRALLELEIKRQQAAQAEREARAQMLRDQIAETRAPFDALLADGPVNPVPGGEVSEEVRRRFEARRAEIAARRDAEIEATADELKQLTAEATLADIAINKALEAVNSPFEVTATRARDAGAPRRSTGGGGGGGSREASDAFADALSRTQERIDALKLEADAVNKTAAETARARAAYDANRIAYELLTKAKETGGVVTAEEIAQVETTVQAYADASEAVIAMREAQESQTRAAENSERALTAVGSAIENGIMQADSFSDALRNVAVQLAQIGLRGAFGLGPAGGFFNDLLGVASGGVGGLISGAFGGGAAPPITGGFVGPGSLWAKGGAFRGGRPVPFAKGGVVSSPTMFPMIGGRTGLMGEAGPEAIMPLTRGPGGKLGVRATGGGGDGGAAVRIFLGEGLRAELLGDARSQTVEIVEASTRGPQFAARVAAASRDAGNARMR